MSDAIDKTLTARYKELQAGADDEAVLEASDDDADQEADDTSTEANDADQSGDDTTPENGARVRDDKGRFVAKEQDSAKPEGVTPPGDSGAGTTAQVADTPKAEPVEPPASWSAEDKALFATLPQGVQATLARRAKEQEADYTRKSQGVAQWTPLEARHGQRARGYGTTTAQLADRLLQTQELLATSPPHVGAQVLLSIANDYNIPPQLLGAQAAPSPAGMPQAPAETAALSQRLDAIQYSMQQQAQAAAVNQAQQQIDTFRDAKNSDGTPAHPHFQALENEILSLVHAARAQGHPINLSEMYAQAVWMNPATREATMKAEREKAAKAADLAAKTPARKNAAAIGMPKSSVGQSPRAAKGRTIEETMTMRLAALGYGQQD